MIIYFTRGTYNVENNDVKAFTRQDNHVAEGLQAQPMTQNHDVPSPFSEGGGPGAGGAELYILRSDTHIWKAVTFQFHDEAKITLKNTLFLQRS